MERFTENEKKNYKILNHCVSLENDNLKLFPQPINLERQIPDLIKIGNKNIESIVQKDKERMERIKEEKKRKAEYKIVNYKGRKLIHSPNVSQTSNISRNHIEVNIPQTDNVKDLETVNNYLLSKDVIKKDDNNMKNGIFISGKNEQDLINAITHENSVYLSKYSKSKANNKELEFNTDSLKIDNNKVTYFKYFNNRKNIESKDITILPFDGNIIPIYRYSKQVEQMPFFGDYNNRLKRIFFRISNILRDVQHDKSLQSVFLKFFQIPMKNAGDNGKDSEFTITKNATVSKNIINYSLLDNFYDQKEIILQAFQNLNANTNCKPNNNITMFDRFSGDSETKYLHLLSVAKNNNTYISQQPIHSPSICLRRLTKLYKASNIKEINIKEINIKEINKDVSFVFDIMKISSIITFIAMQSICRQNKENRFVYEKTGQKCANSIELRSYFLNHFLELCMECKALFKKSQYHDFLLKYRDQFCFTVSEVEFDTLMIINYAYEQHTKYIHNLTKDDYLYIDRFFSVDLFFSYFLNFENFLSRVIGDFPVSDIFNIANASKEYYDNYKNSFLNIQNYSLSNKNDMILQLLNQSLFLYKELYHYKLQMDSTLMDFFYKTNIVLNKINLQNFSVNNNNFNFVKQYINSVNQNFILAYDNLEIIHRVKMINSDVSDLERYTTSYTNSFLLSKVNLKNLNTFECKDKTCEIYPDLKTLVPAYFHYMKNEGLFDKESIIASLSFLATLRIMRDIELKQKAKNINGNELKQVESSLDNLIAIVFTNAFEWISNAKRSLFEKSLDSRKDCLEIVKQELQSRKSVDKNNNINLPNNVNIPFVKLKQDKILPSSVSVYDIENAIKRVNNSSNDESIKYYIKEEYCLKFSSPILTQQYSKIHVESLENRLNIDNVPQNVTNQLQGNKAEKNSSFYEKYNAQYNQLISDDEMML